MGFSMQEYWSGLPFPSPVDHILSELSTMTCPPWVTLHCMAHSFIELDKAVVHVIRLVAFLWLVFSLSALRWKRIRNLWKVPDGTDCLRGKLGLVLMGGDMLSKSLIQFSVDGWGCVLSLLFDLRPNYGGGNEDDWVLLLKSCACTAVLRPCGRPPLTQASTRDLWTLTGKSRSVSCGVTAPFSWVLVHTRFYFCPSSFFCPSSVQVLVALWWDKWWPPPRGLMPQAVWDPGLLHLESLPLQQAIADLYLHRRCSNTQRQVWLSLCGESWCTQDFEPSKHLWRVQGLILNVILTLLPSWWGFSFSLGGGVSFFGGIQHSPVNDCYSVIIFNDQGMK